jgi:hypothetical protein
VSYTLAYILAGAIVSVAILTWEHAHDSPEDRHKITLGAVLVLAALWPLAVVCLVFIGQHKLAAAFVKSLDRKTVTEAQPDVGGFACPSCSRGLPAAARFCRQCGHRVGPTARPPVPTGARR